MKIAYIFICLLSFIYNAKSDDSAYRSSFVIKEEDRSMPINLMFFIDKIKTPSVADDTSFYDSLYSETKVEVYDPWNRINRKIFDFNKKLDDLFIINIVKGYSFTTPFFLGLVDNFYTHWNSTPLLFMYSVLQLDVEGAFVVGWRFIMNTFLGYGGFYDIAGEFGLRKPLKNIDQTLVYYKIPRGPYFVAPILGPTTITNTIELPIIIAMNLYNPYTGGLGLPIGVSLMYSWLGNNMFSFGINFSSLLLPSKYLYLRSYALIFNKDGESDNSDKYDFYKNTYMSITNFSIEKENNDLLKGRFKKEKPIPLSHHSRIDLSFYENEFQLKE